MSDTAGDHHRGKEEATAAATVREQDKLLPIANVGRIMKEGLPPSAKISKEAKETLQECVSEFIAFVTGEASERCRAERRKTLNGDDVCSALASLGFDQYALALRRYLQRYRDLEDGKVAAVVAGEESRRQPQQPSDGSSEQMMSLGGGVDRASSSRQQF